MEPTLSVYAKIAKVQAEIGNVPKNGKGPSAKGGFEYVKYDDIIARLRDLFIEHGLIVSLNTLKHDVHAEQVGTRMVVNTAVHVQYIFTDIDSGENYATSVGGEGSDIGGDTATRKAYTQAHKIMLLQTFNINTGEDLDSDGNAPVDLPEANPIAKAEANGKETPASLVARIGKVINDPANLYTGDSVNALGDKITGKKRDVWFKNVTDLQKVLAAIEAGEVA